MSKTIPPPPSPPPGERSPSPGPSPGSLSHHLPTPPAPSPRAKRRWRIPGRVLAIVVGVCAVGALGYSGWVPSWGGSGSGDRPLAVPAYKGTLRIVVTERGNLESCKTVD